MKGLEEKKKLRAQKIAEFKQTDGYRVLGESMDEKSWLKKNNDDEKKAVVKSYDAKICVDLGLNASEPVEIL